MPSILMELPELPQGFKYTGKYRTPKVGEYYLALTNGTVFTCLTPGDNGPAFIVEKARWRAGVRDTYLYLNERLEVREDIDNQCPAASARYALGNYFRTRQEAIAMADKLAQVLKENM